MKRDYYSTAQACEDHGGIWVSRHYKKDGVRVESYCRKKHENLSGYTTKIRESSVYSIKNKPDERGVLPKGRTQHGYLVTSYNPDGISISEDFFSNKRNAEKHKHEVERGEYF